MKYEAFMKGKNVQIEAAWKIPNMIVFEHLNNPLKS